MLAKLTLITFVLKWLFCSGHNVLDKKTELQKAMEKRSFKAKTKERQVSEEAEKTPFQKMLEERAKRLEQVGTFSISKLCYLKYLFSRSY